MKEKILNYLYNLNPGTKFGLETTRQMLHCLNRPEKKFKSIHIAGTNGKGSTAAFIAQILQEAGYKVGLYTSPHLIRFNERIKINNEEITDEELIKLTKEIKELIEKQGLKPTFFEFTTVLAFLCFARQKVDFAVIEAGMGGRLDATNVIHPELSIITNISFDHQPHLGNTLEKIAREKAAIVKEKNWLITGEKKKSLLKIFHQECRKKKAKMLQVNKLIRAKIISSNLQEQLFRTKGIINSTFRIKLLGEHQADNALLAIIAAKQLGISLKDTKKGLEEARWPGRLEIIRQKPLVIVDGAHNVAGMKTLRKFLYKLPDKLPYKLSHKLPRKLARRKILILGIAKDKEIPKMISLIVPLADEVILTQGNFKPAPLPLLEKEARKYTQKIKKYPKVKEAIKWAGKKAKKDDLIVVTGSLYMVGDVLARRNLFNKQGKQTIP